MTDGLKNVTFTGQIEGKYARRKQGKMCLASCSERMRSNVWGDGKKTKLRAKKNRKLWRVEIGNAMKGYNT